MKEWLMLLYQICANYTFCITKHFKVSVSPLSMSFINMLLDKISGYFCEYEENIITKNCLKCVMYQIIV